MKRNGIGAFLLAGALLASPFFVGPAAAQSTSQIILQVDRPAAGGQFDSQGTLGGWAIDPNVPNAAGISQILVYMDGDASTGRYLGQAQLGGSRPDVATQFDNPSYALSGWNFSLANLGLTGQHAFTFVAYGAEGRTATRTVSSVTLVQPSRPTATTAAPPPPSTAVAPPPPATAYVQAPPPTGAYVQPAPIAYQPPPAPTYYYQAPAAPAPAVPVIQAPVAPAAPALAPLGRPAASLSITSPSAGTSVAGAIVVSGITSATPLNGGVSYTLTDQGGAVIASGTLPVTGAPGQPGTFTGTISYPPGVAGLGTLTLVETDNGVTVGSTATNVVLVNYSLPASPAPPNRAPALPPPLQ